MVGMIKKYKRHFLFADLIFSIVISILIIYFINSRWSYDVINIWIFTNKGDLYPLLATIGGTLLGFVITGVSIIIAFSESEKLRLLKHSNQYQTIFDIYFSTIKYLAITTGVTIFGLITSDKWAVIILYLIIWSTTISLFRIWKCVWVLESIVEIILNNGKKG